MESSRWKVIYSVGTVRIEVRQRARSRGPRKTSLREMIIAAYRGCRAMRMWS